jgi:REP element-mobilizing transposase RayT
MARKPRIEFCGALYHVIARGNQRRRIFLGPDDYEDYLSRMWSYHKKFGFILYAYCLMPNHVHLLVEMGDVLLSKIMQAIQFSYTQSFNRRHRKVGHLFQGRYKAILCQKDEYLLELIRYIHLNPVRAKLVNNPKSYRWSSHRAILGLEKIARCDVDVVLRQFGGTRRSAIRNYESFVLDAIGAGHKDAYYNVRDGRILGEEGFAGTILDHEVEKGNLCHYDISIREITAAVSKEWGIPPSSIISSRRERKGSFGREIVIYLARTVAGTTLRDLGRFFSKKEAAMSNRLRAIEARLEVDNHLKNRVERVCEVIISGRKPKGIK